MLYRVSHLADVDYLLIHGTGDGEWLTLALSTEFIILSCFVDNVHFQNTAQLVEAITEANELFDMQVML